jgi:hypothetical protein
VSGSLIGGVVFADELTGRAHDYRCMACGYGVSGRERLPVCPMCQERMWRSAPTSRGWRPFASLVVGGQSVGGIDVSD